MPRLPFVVNEPDEVDVVEVIEPLIRLQPWAVMAPAEQIQHRLPTAGGDPDCDPVRGVDGLVLHRVKVYDATELTCTVCGETSPDGKCWRCGKGLDPAMTPMVPTISYLNPDEYEFIRRSY